LAPFCYGEGTTINIDEIIIGRCEYFQNEKHPELFVNSSSNCTDVWESFVGAWSYNDPCGLNESSYDEFVALTSHPVPKDEVVMWEGERMYEVSIQLLIIIADTQWQLTYSVVS